MPTKRCDSALIRSRNGCAAAGAAGIDDKRYRESAWDLSSGVGNRFLHDIGSTHGEIGP